MANVKFSRKEFEKQVGKITEKMKEQIALFGTPLESLTADEIELEIFPNRPDLLSMQGFSRAFLAFLGKKNKQYKINKPEKNYIVKIEKSVSSIRPFTACAIVKDLKFDDEKIKEVIDIQEKIHTTLGRNRKKIAIGIYPLEKITLPIKYEAKKPEDIKFIPLEVAEEMTGMQILQRHPAGRDYAHLLEGKEKFPIFIDSAGEILSMPPIINSNKTGKITQDTKDVFIECSGFDFNVLKKTLNILVTMLADMNGKIYAMNLIYGNKKIITPNLEPETMKLSINNANKLLGLNLKEAEIKKLLEKMGYEYQGKGNTLNVLIPAWRTDILHEVDIIEDIAIAYGYNNFQPEIPPIATIGEADKKEIFKKKISEILTGMQMLEISTYHLLSKDDIKKSEKANQKSEIEVEESKTDYKILRQNLLTSCLKILSENVDVEYPQKIFEIGKIFQTDKNAETSIAENENLVMASVPATFTDMKQILETLARNLGIELKIEPAENPSFIDGRVGKIKFKDKNSEKDIGIIGEIHPQTLKNWHIKMPLAVLEISIEEIFDAVS